MKPTSGKSSGDEMRKEYSFDYSKARPNPYAARLKNTTVVVLQPDVAEVFTSSEAVNDLLRSAIVATGAKSKKPRAAKKPAA